MKESFDIPKPKGDVLDALNAEEPLVILLKGHLWIESALNRAIIATLTFPEALNVERLSFRWKVQLGTGLGVIPLEFAPAFQAVNAVRNDIAHDPNAAVDRAESEKIFTALPQEWRQQIQEWMGTERFSDHVERLRFCLALLYQLQEAVATEMKRRRELTSSLLAEFDQ